MHSRIPKYENYYCCGTYYMSLQHKVHSKPPVSVSVLHSIAPLSPALFLYRYNVCLCPSIWLKLGLLWVGRYEMWWFYQL